jgi:DNA polymerase-1
VTTILGRKRRLPGLLSVDKKKRSGAERQAISVTISGSAADLFKVAMIDCHNLLRSRKWEGHILMTVHDELVVEVPERHADEGLQLVQSAMEDIENPLTGEPMLSVPVTADAKIVERWSDAK